MQPLHASPANPRPSSPRSCACSWRPRAAWPAAWSGSSCSRRGAPWWRASPACPASSLVRLRMWGTGLAVPSSVALAVLQHLCCAAARGSLVSLRALLTSILHPMTSLHRAPNHCRPAAAAALPAPTAGQAPTRACRPRWRRSRMRATRATCCAASGSWGSACARWAAGWWKWLGWDGRDGCCWPPTGSHVCLAARMEATGHC